MVRQLISLSMTRPDIAFAVGVSSQFMHAPAIINMEAVYRIFRYLKGNPRKGWLFTKRKGLRLEAYTNAD